MRHGRQREAEGQLSDALIAYDRVESGHWTFPWAALARGRILAQLGEVDGARKNLTEIARTIDSPELEAIVTLVPRSDPGMEGEPPRAEAATEVSRRARDFAENPPERLSGLDRLLPRRYLGSSHP